ncbi:MAG: hypothetical protein J0M21_10600, partial [Xanthomonadales bacterium]|nr:hypothetical protein [Xanthomonadales bacterium]
LPGSRAAGGGARHRRRDPHAGRQAGLCARAVRTLHALDALGVDAIWLETPPRDEAWRDVHDRLSRAATPG